VQSVLTALLNEVLVMLTVKEKLKICFDVICAKNKKETYIFINGYHAGLADNKFSNEVIQEQERMLLNAHQLVKNGISKPWLKFDEFKTLMKFDHDINGKRISEFV
jgi:hypothetical protein